MRLLFALIAFLGLTSMVQAQSTPWPDVPQATGDPHPEGNEFWRKNHMVLLRHDRDLTLRDGERDVQASLAACVTCHAVKDDAGEAVPITDERNFCRVCHDYVAVKLDCFTCHRSTPPVSTDNLLMAKPDDPNSIAAYLERLNAQAAEASE